MVNAAFLQSHAGLFIMGGLFCVAGTGLRTFAVQQERYTPKDKQQKYRNWNSYMGLNPLSGNTMMGSFPPMPSEGSKAPRWRDVVRKREDESEPPADWEPKGHQITTDEGVIPYKGLLPGIRAEWLQWNPFRPYPSNVSKPKCSSSKLGGWHYYSTYDNSDYYKSLRKHGKMVRKDPQHLKLGDDPEELVEYWDYVDEVVGPINDKKWEQHKTNERNKALARAEKKKASNAFWGRVQEPIYDAETGQRLTKEQLYLPPGRSSNGREARVETMRPRLSQEPILSPL